MTHPPFIDFRLTQSHIPHTQLLNLAEAPTYPSYYVTLHDSGKGLRPSSLHETPDVSVSHANYLASSFATAVFHRYRNSIGVTYPETGVRRQEGDVTTTVEGVLPEVRQVVECESLGKRRFGVEMDVGGGGRLEDYLWARPSRDEDRVHMLELRIKSGSGEADGIKGEGAIAKILMKNWDAVKRDELIAVVRVREDMFLNSEEREDRRKGADQILVTAVVLLERLRRRHKYVSYGSTWLSYC